MTVVSGPTHHASPPPKPHRRNDGSAHLMPRDWYTLDELAEHLGRNRREIERLANRGRIPGRKRSGEWQFHSAEVTQWLERSGAPRVIGLTWLALRYGWTRLHTAYAELSSWGSRMLLLAAHGWCRATGKSVPLFLCQPDVCNASMHHEHRHMPTYEGDAIYFRAEADQHSIRHADAQDSWSRTIKGYLVTISVTGNGREIMKEPHVKLLAEKLAMELARAQKMSNDAS